MLGHNKVLHRRVSAIAASVFALGSLQSATAEDLTAGKKVSGNLIHITHYDPKWTLNDAKASEQPFDVETAIRIVEEMGALGMNMVIVDIEDGVKYESAPILERHYSAPMDDLVRLAKAARENGVEFVPKLNFSKSSTTVHDHWLAPYIGPDYPGVRDEYFELGFKVIDEILEKCGPINYFHIGMDEDHDRSVRQFVRDIKLLHDYLTKKGVRTVIWNDRLYLNRDVKAEVFAEKFMAATPQLPTDIVHLLWDYDITHEGVIKDLKDQGIDVWVAPGTNETNVRNWVEIAKDEGADGMIMSNWIKAHKDNEEFLVESVRTVGPLLLTLE